MSTLIKDPLEKLAKKMEHNTLKFELKIYTLNSMFDL